jgi:hypothetical protein
MPLEPDEIKAVLDEAKGDGPRNKARKELVAAYELMESAVAQNLPPWDRRWLEFEAVNRIAAALGVGGFPGGDEAAYDAVGRDLSVAIADSGVRAQEHGPVDADPGEGGSAA